MGTNLTVHCQTTPGVVCTDCLGARPSKNCTFCPPDIVTPVQYDLCYSCWEDFSQYKCQVPSTLTPTISGVPTLSANSTSIGTLTSESGQSPTNTSGESPTTPTVPTQPTVKSQSVLSSGAKIGIGVGCAVAGAFVIGLILFFLFRRQRVKRKHTSRSQVDTSIGGVGWYNNEKISTGTKGGAAVSSLAQPAEDDAISGGMSKLRDKIKNHVQNYYHTSQIDGSALDGKDLQSWSCSSEVSTVALKAMLLAPETRHAALRSYIAWQILSRCNGDGKEVPSLLPGQLSMIAQNINNTTGREATIAIQRKTTAAKMIRQNGATTDSSVKHEIIALLDVMDPVLRPFTSAGQGSEQRVRNLESVVSRAAGFAFLLFSQPSLWRFDWTVSKQGEIFVMPTLQQLVNEEGCTLGPPKIFSHPEIVRR